MQNIKLQAGRRWFLIDGVGALISCLMLGLILPRWQVYVGLPVSSLHFLSGLAGGFVAYDFLCYLFFPQPWTFYLRVIAWINRGYCLLTLGLLVWHWEAMIIWGWLYFVGEIVLVWLLSHLELRIAKGT